MGKRARWTKFSLPTAPVHAAAAISRFQAMEVNSATSQEAAPSEGGEAEEPPIEPTPSIEPEESPAKTIGWLLR